MSTPEFLTEQFLARFWSRVVKTPTCWEWIGNRDHLGYGKIRLFVGSSKKLSAHKISYQLSKGWGIPYKLHVRHSCDNPSCVNPDHLSLGTAKDNAQDKVDRGRAQNGEAIATGVLTQTLVLAIRAMKLELGYSQREIAKRFGISHNTVGDILRRDSWKHI